MPACCANHTLQQSGRAGGQIDAEDSSSLSAMLLATAGPANARLNPSKCSRSDIEAYWNGKTKKHVRQKY